MVDERVGMALSGLSRCASIALTSGYRLATLTTTDAPASEAGFESPNPVTMSARRPARSSTRRP
jgi:hypothetical protein